MAKKNRTGNREPRKPKQPKTVKPVAGSLSDLVKSRAADQGRAS
jgi:hypothetical protein